MLTEKKVPKYIKEIAQRLHPVLIKLKDNEERDIYWGYTFRLDAKWKCGYERQMLSDAEKLVSWATKHHAAAKVISCRLWQDKYDDIHTARRNNWRNHCLIGITDPVAWVFEKANYFREVK